MNEFFFVEVISYPNGKREANKRLMLNLAQVVLAEEVTPADGITKLIFYVSGGAGYEPVNQADTRLRQLIGV